MEYKESHKEAQLNFGQEPDPYDRRDCERRKECGEGYTYVSTVGWICRREQSRRKDDSFEGDF